MEFINGADRILFLRIQGNWLPIGCLTDNSMSETAEMLETTTRDNAGWTTSRPVLQSYTLAFNGLQLNSTVPGGNFNVASYDKLKQLKREKTLLDWKIEGTVYPIVDYGQGYIDSLSEANAIDEFMSFSGNITGFGMPRQVALGTTVLNTGDSNEVVNNGDENTIIKIGQI